MSTDKMAAREHGLQLLKAGNPAAGIPWLEKAIAETPSDVELHLYLALAYAKQDDMFRSVEVLEHAADLAPTSAKVHYNLGVAYQKTKNLTFAREEYMRALGCDPAYIPAKSALDAIMADHHKPSAPESV